MLHRFQHITSMYVAHGYESMALDVLVCSNTRRQPCLFASSNAWPWSRDPSKLLFCYLVRTRISVDKLSKHQSGPAQIECMS